MNQHQTPSERLGSALQNAAAVAKELSDAGMQTEADELNQAIQETQQRQQERQQQAREAFDREFRNQP